MTEAVVHGQIVDQLGLIQQHHTIVHPGPYPQRVEKRTKSMQLRPDSLRREQRASNLNVEHELENIVGRLVALEQGHDGIWATFTSNDLAFLLRDGATPWYLSAEIRWRGDATFPEDVQLDRVALVRAPGANGIRPARILLGSLGEPRHRERWQLEGATRDRIERAAEELKHRGWNDPVQVRDRTAEREQLLRRSNLTPVEIAMAMEQQYDRRPPGPLRHGPRGRVISVH